eukprot:scaffold137231_cov30-Tisochrysis_lutea.AAC.4
MHRPSRSRSGVRERAQHRRLARIEPREPRAEARTAARHPLLDGAWQALRDRIPRVCAPPRRPHAMAASRQRLARHARCPVRA